MPAQLTRCLTVACAGIVRRCALGAAARQVPGRRICCNRRRRQQWTTDGIGSWIGCAASAVWACCAVDVCDAAFFTASCPCSRASLMYVSVHAVCDDRACHRGGSAEGDACPTCRRDFASLTGRLPTCKRMRCRVLCAVTGDVISEANPAVVLPDGHLCGMKVRGVRRGRGGGGEPEGKREFPGRTVTARCRLCGGVQALPSLTTRDGTLCCPFSHKTAPSASLRRAYIL